MDRLISLEARSVDLAVEPPFLLGRARLEPQAHEYVIDGKPTRMQPQTLKVLIALHDRSGQVVSRDELVDRCWGGRIVGDDVINRCISLLRQFAAESGGFEIQTVPKSGYRLIAIDTPQLDDSPQIGGGAWPAARRRFVVGGCVSVVMAAAAGAWIDFGPVSASPSTRIAVLPFANLTGDPTQAYFSDGIAEELRAALSRAGMQVIGRTSSEAVRNMDARAAAAKLGVPNILIGSVRRSPGTIRIDAQLVHGSDGVEQWSQSYDRAPGDVIKIQTNIAENVAMALSAALGNGVRSAIRAGGTRNPEAQRFVLQALAAERAGTQPGDQRALKLFEDAIAADRLYGDAYARKAYLLEYYAESYASTFAEVNAYRSDALRSARIALRIAPDLSRAHWALANYLQGVLDFASSDIEYRRAIDFAPGDAGPMSDYALLVLRIGSSKQALALADRALRLDPLDPDAYRRRFLVLYYRRDFANAVAFSKQVERFTPELFIWSVGVGLALIALNQLDEAVRYLLRGPKDFYERLVGECVLLIRKNRRAEAEAKLAIFRKMYGDLDNYQYAQIYAQLNDKDRAFKSLSKAWALRDTGLLWLRVDPLLDPIRSDRRFEALLRSMKLRA